MSHRASMLRLAQLVAVLLLVLPSRALFAQTGTITGKVTDAATSQAIADARVIVRGTTLEALTNRDGEFRLVAVRAGSAVVGVFRLGFKATTDTVRVTAGQTTTMTVQMTASTVNLSQIVVTGTAGNQERKAQAAVVASVSAADIIATAPVFMTALNLRAGRLTSPASSLRVSAFHAGRPPSRISTFLAPKMRNVHQMRGAELSPAPS